MKNEEFSTLSQKNRLLQSQLELLIQHKSIVQNNYQKLTNAKAFKIWQLFNKIKNNPKLIIKGLIVLANKGPKGLINRLRGNHLATSKLIEINNQYQIWLKNNRPSEKLLSEQYQIQKSFSYRPIISIITPVFNPDKEWLIKCIESVLHQSYPNWELCLADDCSTKPHIKEVLNNYSKKDKRIKVIFRKENGHISRASNSALEIATGEFVGLLDHDDEIWPNALWEIVNQLNKNRETDFLYSDEDKIEMEGRHTDPFFKPDWSPELLLSNNYLCHFSVIRKKLVDEVGGFRPGYEGSQDYDLFLRITEKTGKIFHIPNILYSWRKVPGSTAAIYSVKSYCNQASINSLKDAIVRRKIKASVENGLVEGTFRVKYLITRKPLISIIIPTKDKIEYLKKCILSILDKTDYSNYEIIVLDTGSRETETYKFYKEMEKVRKFRKIDFVKKQFNFAEANTWAAKKVKGDYILFLNNDTEVINRGWLTSMMEYAEQDNVGIVGAKLLYSNNTIQHMGVVIGLRGGASHAGVCFPEWEPMGFPFSHMKDVVRNVTAITGACLLIKRNLFNSIGGFDKIFRIAFNDIDLCLKIRKLGFEIIYTPYAILIHHESISFGRPYENQNRSNELFEKELGIFNKKWNLANYEDPFYNRNLTLKDESLSLRI